jgi:predicted MFS family arabinose efflux permease
MRDDAAPIHLGLGAFLLTVFAPFGLGYFLSYFYRAVNAVVAPDLVRDLALTASGLGFLTAAYLVSFAVFQLPLGILLDRFGPRRVQAVLLCLTALGATIFGLAASFPVLAIGRAMIGIGSAGGLISGFKAVSLTVPEQRQPLANASIMAVGAVGLLFATVPTEILAAHWGWRSLFVGLAATSLVIALLVFAAAPERPSRDVGHVTFIGQARGLGTVLSNPVFWRVAPLVATVCGCQIGIQSLWAGPWLADVAGLDRSGVAQGLAWMAAGFLVGTLLSGAIADRLAARGISVLTVTPVLVMIYLLTEWLMLAEVTRWPFLLVLVFGMFGQTPILLYPWLVGYFGGSRAAGRTISALNVLVFMTAFATQYGFGAILDLWPSPGPGSYHPQAYQVAIGICIAVQSLSLVWYFAGRPAADARAEIAL